MADAVRAALSGRTHLLVEAGTGVGKSFAYLAPAVERILEHGERVVVATNTIALQEQLVEKDVPILAHALGDERLRPVLVKGRGNYMSIRRLKLASERADRLLPDEASRVSLRQIEDWAYETRDGSLSTLPTLERPEIWDLARSDADNCMGRKCPNYEACFYQGARRAAERANLLICNHALFFSDLALRASGVSILPDFHHVILDEAHAVEDAASDHFGLRLTGGRIAHLLRSLYEPRRRRGYLAALAAAPLASGDTDVLDRAILRVLDAGHAATEFFDAWRHLIESGDLPGGRIREPGLVQDTLTSALSELAAVLGLLRDRTSRDEDRFELTAYMRRAMDLAQTCGTLVEQSEPGCVYWAEVEGASGRPRVTLACAPIEIAPVLREHLFGQGWGCVLTSATLTTKVASSEDPKEQAEAAFAHAMARVGCEGASTLQVGSPFDYARQVQLIVDPSMPRPDDSPRFALALAPRVIRHVGETAGGAFVLFTSYAMLKRVADLIEPDLDRLGLSMLVQGRDGARRLLIERFRESEHAVLMGTSSFWQGVDVRGHALRNVIITRLPFEPPDRPLTEARLDAIRARGGDPFREDSLPRAILRFKQGFGRLIRSGSDAGRVVVLDPRLTTTGYGRAFLAALPPGVSPHVDHHSYTE